MKCRIDGAACTSPRGGGRRVVIFAQAGLLILWKWKPRRSDGGGGRSGGEHRRRLSFIQSDPSVRDEITARRGNRGNVRCVPPPDALR